MSQKKSISAEWLEIDSNLKAYYARPTEPGRHPVILLIYEAFGATDHIKECVQRFASEGFCVVCPDLYHDAVYDYQDRTNAIAHLKTLNDDTVMDECDRALRLSTQRPECRGDCVATLGFCMGGRYALLANARLSTPIAASVSFYGGGIAPKEDPFGRTPVIEQAAALQGPALLHYGARDGSIPPDEHARVAQALTTANKRYDMHVFPDAGHSFFNDARESYADAAAKEAWDISLSFLARRLPVER